jgi:hypothetical protein
MKKIVKIPGIIIIVLILLAVIIRLVLSLAAVKIANRELPGILNTEASVGSISLGLLRGYVSIKDLRIGQPEGFGEGNLLLVPELSVKVKLSSLYNPPLIVEEVILTDWEVNIVKNADGLMNIDAIQPESSPEPAPASKPGSGKKSEGEEDSSSKAILVQKFSIKNLSCSYTDHAIALEREEAAEVEFTISTDGESEEIIITARSDESTETGGEKSEFTTKVTVELAPAAGLSEESIPARPVTGRSPDETAESVPVISKESGKNDSIRIVPAGGEETPGNVDDQGDESEEEFTEDIDKGNAEDEDEEVLRVKIASLDLLITNLLIDPEADSELVEPAQALLTARIIQEPFMDGLLGIHAWLGPVGTGFPAVNAVFRLANLELEPLDVVVPDGVAQVLGGSALDLTVDLKLADYLLDCEIEVEASGGHNIPLYIGGTPDQPEIDTSSLLFGVMLHFGGGVGNLVGNIGGAGYQVGSAIGESSLAVGVGTANVLGSIGGGLFKTVTSAATGDLDGAAEGLSDTTVGTANEAAATGGEVAGKAADGATATADSTTGEDADREWREDTSNRWRKSWDEARELLKEMEFPPPPRDDADTVPPTPGEALTFPSPIEEGVSKAGPVPTPGEFEGDDPF